MKNSHDFGNGRARCLPFANTSRFLFPVSPPSLFLTARSIYQSVSASVSVSVCVCSSWIEKAQPENNFSVSWLFNIAFCHAKKEVNHCTQVLRETRDKNAINLPTIPSLNLTPFPTHPYLSTPAKSFSLSFPNNKLKLQKLQSAWCNEMNFYFAAHGAIVNEIHNLPPTHNTTRFVLHANKSNIPTAIKQFAMRFANWERTDYLIPSVFARDCYAEPKVMLMLDTQTAGG